jgi:crotonobetainyl-CoA:carnitine CoA-transferase CaiB-like acyl-CoA transferase
MSGPLSGVRVLDLSSVVSGPLATMHLADQGADVIKVEPPSGDINRRSRQKISPNGEFSALFVSTNRGKRSLTLDLKKPAALSVLKKLIERSDVLVQNFRPGTMERLGLGEDVLRSINPRLIYVSISGVGETGPYVRKRIYDPMIQALSGLADIQSDQRTGRPQMIRTILADKTTAIFAAQAVTAALYAREKTGLGQNIRLSLLGTMLSYLWPEGMMPYTVVGGEDTALSTNSGPDLVFRTLDGYITVGTISEPEWHGFCAAVGKPELKDDDRFNTAEKRSINATARIELMADMLATRTSAEWLERLDAADVPCAPVLRRKEILANEQVIATGLIDVLEQPAVGRIRQARPAAQFDGTPSAIGGPAPGIGEHTDEILSELGLSRSDIEDLERQAAVRPPRTAAA